MAYALATRLAGAPDYCVHSPRAVRRALEQGELEPTKPKTTQALRRSGRLLGADVLLTGVLTVRGATVRVQLRVLMLDDSRQPPAPIEPVTGGLGAVGTLEAALLGVALRELGLETWTAAASLTTREAAWEPLLRGLVALNAQPLGPRAADSAAAPALGSKAQKTALAQLDQALALDAEAFAARSTRAVLLTLAGRRDEAEATLEREDELRPPTWVQAGIFVALRRGDWALALQRLTAAQAQAPRDLGLWLMRAEMHLHVGRLREATYATKAALALAPRYPGLWLLRGYLEAKRGHAALGLVSTQRAVELAPEAADLRFELVQRQIDAQRYNEALGQLTKLAHAPATLPRALALLAYVHLLLGDDVQAIDAGEQALRHLDPEAERRRCAYTRLTLARAWGHLGQYDVALEQLGYGKKLGLASSQELDLDPKLARLRTDPRYAEARF